MNGTMTLGEMRKKYEVSLSKERKPQTKEEVDQIRQDSFDYVEGIAKKAKLPPYDS